MMEPIERDRRLIAIRALILLILVRLGLDGQRFAVLFVYV